MRGSVSASANRPELEEKVCLCWRLSAALHCALYSVWVVQLQTIFPGQKLPSRVVVVVLCVHTGGDPPPSIHSVCSARTHRGEIPGMLSMPEHRGGFSRKRPELHGEDRRALGLFLLVSCSGM